MNESIVHHYNTALLLHGDGDHAATEDANVLLNRLIAPIPVDDTTA